VHSNHPLSDEATVLLRADLSGHYADILNVVRQLVQEPEGWNLLYNPLLQAFSAPQGGVKRKWQTIAQGAAASSSFWQLAGVSPNVTSQSTTP
jgi:hypothetical protein